jgi:hypothetical protein
MDANTSYLRQYQAEQDRGDKFHDEVEKEINFLTSEGQEYYPFTPDHIQEAIAELDLANSNLLAVYSVKARKEKIDTVAHLFLADCFLNLVKDYWDDCAKSTAINNVEGRE